MESTPLQRISYLALRLMGSLIFIMAGLNHLFDTAGPSARLQKAPLGDLATWMAPAETLVMLAGIGLLIGGLALLAGFITRLAAAGLLAILIPITLTIQVAAEGSGPLFKNIALGGILLFFIANGSVWYGLDQWLHHRKITSMKTKNNHKNYVAALVIGLLTLTACIPTALPAQTATPAAEKSAPATSAKNYAVLISQPNHVKAAVNTAEAITPSSTYQRQQFVVMACAKSVEAFVKGSAMEQEIQKGKAAGVTYRICGMSLTQFTIDPASLVEGVEIIPNGLTHMFELQAQGFITVEL
ncbi:DsrE family protein [Cesiribacter andamanensis]|uniref:Uncharacterized protein n=1 Tax=Cesiribacter andamanensis AMV16 TaxID=1279009 RepID=M7N7V0_9BACT|nr:DoxX family membrane protein [Cesiribacter andamanensis]EMR03322.1 hypothetical protein ADICEAN_01499 [Cesiribacter andamanensis AMV16]